MRDIDQGAVRAEDLGEPLARFPKKLEHVYFDEALGSAHVGVGLRTFFQAPQVGVIDARSVVPDDAIDSVAAARLDRLRELARCEAIVSGFVHVDTCHDPYQEIYASGNLRSVPSIYAPGYYWAVLLTQPHIKALGGADAVIERAPVWRVEPIPRGTPTLLCVLTESPDDLTEEAVRAWREFLLPVLPFAVPRPLEGTREGRAPLSRPVWIFEGPALPRYSLTVLRGQVSHPIVLPDMPVLQLEGPSVPPEDPSEPDVLHCSMPMGPRFDLEVHGPLIQAVVDAWLEMGLRGDLRDLDASLRSVNETVEFHGGDGDPVVMEWGFAPGTADPMTALNILHGALLPLERFIGASIIGHAITLDIR
ncbi:hypothetical protein [Aquihabitans sp. McL0605]|uniref:hypothetical protein n=1 Tax=Aquihabitans sp. McL0605 TaxID=3415671 RepID=UPI003CEA706B